MKVAATPAEKIDETGVPAESDYQAWKRRKIEASKAQSEDRDSMIPADQVWRDLGLER